MARASVALKEQLASPLVQLHSYAHSYLCTFSLHGQLYEVCSRQVRTIGGATLHHVVIAHQKDLNWIAMVTHYMRAHNQWLHMACQRVEEICLASFRKASHDFLGEYDRRVWDWCYHNYAQAGDRKNTLFSWAASASIQRHLETRVVRWVAILDHWLTNASSQKERHLATEADIPPPPPPPEAQRCPLA